jgi:hypothetical protein
MATRLLCVRYVAGGLPRVQWLAPVETMVVDPREPGLAHALGLARAEHGTAIRVEFHEPGVPGRPVLTVEVP